MQKKALITGITGQDGSYLADFLLDKGYNVFGMHRRSSIDNYFYRIEHLKGRINLICADLLDFCSLEKIIKEIEPNEVYNLAAQSQVRHSFDQPHLTMETNWLGTERLLHLTKKYVPFAKFYQASTSEMFGQSSEKIQNENTLFNPVSPYAESKVQAHKSVKRARKNGLFACNGILFNHESPRRGIEFVTRKLSDGIARIKLGMPQRTGKDYLEIGNLEAKRDWGYAKDYVRAMWLMLQQDKSDDYVIATGETYSIRDFIKVATDYAGIKIRWEGEKINEKGYNNDKMIISINPKFFRPKEVPYLCGDSSKARKILGWKPKMSFDELVEIMVKEDIKKLKES